MPIFTPPTHEEAIRTTVRPLNYFRLTWAASVVRVNGTFRSVRSPSQDLLTAAGEEGTDFFKGGRTYEVTDVIGDELEALGYEVTPTPGYGLSGYGLSPYGSQGFGA